MYNISMRFLLSLFIVFFCCNSAFAVDIQTFDLPPYRVTADMDTAVVYHDRYKQKRLAIECALEKSDAPKDDIITTSILDFTDMSSTKEFYMMGLNRRLRNTWELIESYDGTYLTGNPKYRKLWVLLDKKSTQTKIKVDLPEIQREFHTRIEYQPRDVFCQIYLLTLTKGLPKYLQENGY